MLGVWGGDADVSNAPRRVLQWVRASVIVVVLGILAITLWNYVTAEQRLRGVCALLAHGMDMGELRRFAADHGLNAPRSTSGVTFMVERRTFRRYGCQLELADGRLIRGSYNFAD